MYVCMCMIYIYTIAIDRTTTRLLLILPKDALPLASP